jgi:hypothetical protein
MKTSSPSSHQPKRPRISPRIRHLCEVCAFVPNVSSWFDAITATTYKITVLCDNHAANHVTLLYYLSSVHLYGSRRTVLGTSNTNTSVLYASRRPPVVLTAAVNGKCRDYECQIEFDTAYPRGQHYCDFQYGSWPHHDNIIYAIEALSVTLNLVW